MEETIEFDEIPRILDDTEGYIECGKEYEENKQTILYNTTYIHTLKDISFGNIPYTNMIEIFKDGRAFSHLIEPWLAINYPLIHVTGCKQYDHTNDVTKNIKYEHLYFQHLLQHV